MIKDHPDFDRFEKIITIQECALKKDIVIRNIYILLNFMYEHNPHIEYFKFSLSDSEKVRDAKDLTLLWAERKKRN